VDRTQLFIPELIEDHGLESDEFEPVKDALKAAFQVTQGCVFRLIEDKLEGLFGKKKKTPFLFFSLSLLCFEFSHFMF